MSDGSGLDRRGGESAAVGTVHELLARETVQQLARKLPPTVRAGASIRAGLEAMLSVRGCGAVLVVEGTSDSLCGIFTERDYLDRVAEQGLSLDGPVDDVMSKNPVTLSPTDTVSRAVELMKQKGYRHLPMVDSRDGRQEIVGLVSAYDLIHHLAEHFPTEVLHLPPRLHQDAAYRDREGG